MVTSAIEAENASPKPSYADVHAALERVLRHLGEMPHDWPSRELFLAFCAAEELLRPDEFTRRFMSRADATAEAK